MNPAASTHDHEALLPPEPVQQVAELAPALQIWQQRLAAAGLACRGVALFSADPAWRADFLPTEAQAVGPTPQDTRAIQDIPGSPAMHAAPTPQARIAQAWADARLRVTRDSPVALARVEPSGLLVATHLQLPSGQPAIVGALLAPPHNDRSLQLLLLSLGWLQLTLSAASLAHNQRAAELLQLVGQVSAQQGARAAAQDWVNRTAAWARAQLAPDAFLALSLFEVRHECARWWVAADTSHAEAGSPAVQAATEVAQRAFVEAREFDEAGQWALPLMDQGEVVAVLVAAHGPAQLGAAQLGAARSGPAPLGPAQLVGAQLVGTPPGGAPLDPIALQVLKTSALVAEPLLRHWRDADRPWAQQTWLALRRIVTRLRGPGHWAWKAGALGAVLGLALLLWLPVDDRITASTVIEGRTRQLVTLPFEGFIKEVLVRPGDTVRQGQVLLRLDDRDLQLEAAKLRSDRDQAAGKLRQALADREAAAVAVASAELQGVESQLAMVEAKLARAELVAPLDGLVVSGDWVQQIGAPLELGKEAFEIASNDGYRVVLHVPERDIARVHPGQPGVLRLAGQPDVAHAFEVSRVTATASVQEGSNGFRAEAAWIGSAPALSPGMQGVSKVTVGRANLLTIWTRESVNWLRMKLWTYWF